MKTYKHMVNMKDGKIRFVGIKDVKEDYKIEVIKNELTLKNEDGKIFTNFNGGGILYDGIEECLYTLLYLNELRIMESARAAAKSIMSIKNKLGERRFMETIALNNWAYGDCNGCSDENAADLIKCIDAFEDILKERWVHSFRAHGYSETVKKYHSHLFDIFPDSKDMGGLILGVGISMPVYEYIDLACDKLEESEVESFLDEMADIQFGTEITDSELRELLGPDGAYTKAVLSSITRYEDKW